MANGHPEAWRYPVGLVYVESSLVAARIDAAEAQRAALLQSAISTVLGGKKANQAFQDEIARLLSWE